MSIWQFARHFSKTPPEFQITLGEGNTPLVRSRRLGPEAGLKNLYFKLESTNPTGSYKDRFAAAAISDMLANGRTHSVATSSGNTGSALAAYCAAAGIDCEIAIVETAPNEKLKQMMAYGARIYRIRGFGTDAQITKDAFEMIVRKSAAPGASMQISAFAKSPAGMAGVKTISYELHQQLDGGIDHVFVPAGGGGLCLAVARGFDDLRRSSDPRTSGPAVHCAQPSGNDTIASPLRSGDARAREVVCTSKISGLQVANVIDGHEVVAACRASGGTGHVVEDDDVYAVQKKLAREEGLFIEPAGCVSVTAALNAAKAGELAADSVVVCLLTGIGFKDAPSVERMVAQDACPMLNLNEVA